MDEVLCSIAAFQRNDFDAVSNLLHPSVQLYLTGKPHLHGKHAVGQWIADMMDDCAELSVLDVSADDKAAVVVAHWAAPEERADQLTEYTVVVNTLDDMLIRIVVDD